MQNSDITADLRGHVRRFGVIFTEHSIGKMSERNITTNEVRDVILKGEIIEIYAVHAYGPCCLIYGQTGTEKHVHVVCSVPPLVRIVTTYEPDPEQWSEYRVRR